MTYASDQLLAEIAYVAYHFHWSFVEILDLEHPLRLSFVSAIEGLNTQARTAG